MHAHPIFNRRRIFAPGPTPVPDEVRAVLGQAPLHHRTKEFIKVLDRTLENLKYVFQTQQRAYILSASGTGAMETVVVNLMNAGDEVIVINGGKFGERWLKLTERFDLNVHEYKVAWGNAADPVELAKMLSRFPKTKAVFFQASETSTGTYHPVKEITEIVKSKSDALVIVDAITALGVSDLPMDAWGIDALVSGSQKAFMLPPGLAFLALSEKAIEARTKSKLKKFYFNLDAEDKSLVGGETAWTPAVGLIMALDEVLIRIKHVGLAALFEHHAKLARSTRQAVEAMGLKLFSPANPSPAVTAVYVPSEITEGGKIVSHLRDAFGITIAGGQDAFKGKLFRLAHLGFYDELDMATMFSALELTLTHLGYPLKLGVGVGALLNSFNEYSMTIKR